ncbi:MAG TPA: TauD/TfdA family dioxygenase, partial [Alphaproteobacteria bacterium]
MKVTPLSPVLGAEVTGIDLSEPLARATVDEIYRRFLDHQVLVFRNQSLTPLR